MFYRPFFFLRQDAFYKKKHVYLPRILGTKQYFMSTHDLRDSFAKREIRKILVAAILLIAVSTAYYLYLRHDIRLEAERRANNVLKQTEMLIRSRMEKIETIVNSMRFMAEQSLDNPDEMYSIARYTVESTQQITGADISFVENYYPGKGRWFQAYAGYPKGCDSLVMKQLGGENHDYLTMEWFQRGIASDNGNWSSPYFDHEGGRAAMMTFAQAIQDSFGRKVGVVGADITLDTLSSIVSKIRLYPHSYCTLVSESTGEMIVGPPAEDKENGRCQTYTELIRGKNMILTLTISNADIYKRLRKASLAFFLLAIGFFLSIFLIAYGSVRNSWRLGVERLKNQHIEDELSIARRIQLSLVPSGIEGKEKLPQLDIHGFLQPAKYVGGDLYDYYVRDNKLIFCIGDIAGKGVPAAMLMSIAHSLFRTLSAHNDQPERIMHELNSFISDNNPDIMFITMFLGVLDLKSGIVNYCNAGHNPPILIQSGQAKYLDSEPSLILGLEINAEYSSHTLQLGLDDTLFLFTDGLTEAENIEKTLFGEVNALKIADGFGEMSAQEQIDTMHQAVRRFVGSAEQSDDLTMLAIRFKGCDNTLVLDNDIQELRKLEPFLKGFFIRNNIDSPNLSQFELALEEAVANVIMYAYPEGEKGTMEISFGLKEGQIHACISDNGVPFNPLQRPETNLPNNIEEFPIGGLGIHLIKEIMDKVNYQNKDGKNMLTMAMNI